MSSSDDRDSEVPIRLLMFQASETASILLHLAALLDVEDPEGLRDAFGNRNASLEHHILTDTQLMMLNHPAYRSDERQELAARLRIISSAIEGQLPPEAPAIHHHA
jgi:hypothetical protein